MGSPAAAQRVAGLLAVSFALMPAAFSAGVSQRAGAASDFGKLPLTFEENRGQTDKRVRYISRGSGYTLFLTPSEAVLSLTGFGRDKKSVSTSVRMNFVGAREASVTGADPRATRSSYFIGSDRSAWRTNLRHYGQVQYRGVYPGIDAVFYGNQRQLEYDFIVAPGADPKQIRLKFDGAQSLMTSPNGDLIVRTALGDLRQLRPVIYQEVEGQRRTIDGRYKVNGTEASFEVAAYDRRKPLVIDPVLAWATFFGGNASDTVTAMSYDVGGAVVVAGITASSNFNAAIRFIGITRGGTSDAFVAKLANNGAGVAWASFYGGADLDEALGVATDADAAVYITGRTNSPTIPLVSALQSSLGGGTDAFIAKISADGNSLGYSTYLGGFGDDRGEDVAVDAQNQAVVVGTTASTNFWATKPFTAFRGGRSDAFATKFNAGGTNLVWSTYLGGHVDENGFGVALDSNGAAYVTGSTTSFSFVTTQNVVQPAMGSQNLGNGTFAADAFVSKIGPTGTLDYSTFLGGAAFDEGRAIAVDAAGNAYVFGDTESGNFPTINAFQAANRGNMDTFVTKLNANASARVYSTMLGGTGQDSSGDIALRGDRATVVGSTNSTDFPTLAPSQGTNFGGGDIFVTELNPAGNGLGFSTYYGGTDNDAALTVALDPSGNIFVGGHTLSFNLPVTANTIQPAFAGVQDGFIAKFSNCTVTLTPTRNGAPGALHSSAQEGGIITVTGPSDCTWNPQKVAPWITLVNQTATAGNGSLGYIVSQNIGAPRSGIITIAGVNYTVEQQGGPITSGCMYPLTDASAIVPATFTDQTFTLGTSHNACNWTATSDRPWLQVFPTSGNTTANISYTVFPNFGTQIREAVITFTAQGASQTFKVIQAADNLLSQNERFVTLLYSNFLGRYPAPSEIALQNSVLNSGTSRANMAASFFNVPEFLQGGRFVAGLYLGLLGRDPEFGGWLFQRNALTRNIVSQDQLVSNFINSPEFQLKGIATNADFVRLLYVQVLGRTADQAEVDFHVSTMTTGTNPLTRVQVARNFLNSEEFRRRLDIRMTAFLLYATLLQRDPTPNEMSFRASQLQAGTSVAALAGDFIISSEFQGQLQ